MPPAPQNMVATVLEWELPNATPAVRPVRRRRATPHPAAARPRTATSVAPTHAPLALPWYGVGGVPALSVVNEEAGRDAEIGARMEDAADPALGATGDVVHGGHVLDPAEEDAAVFALDALRLKVPPAFSAGGHNVGDRGSRALDKRARRKRAKETTRKLRRSTRPQAKEEPGFELPEARAARVQQAKFDFTGASRRLHDALSQSYLLSDPYYL